MKNWIYFATAEKASLASTIEAATNTQFLWRTAFNEKGAEIANVGSIKPGDRVVLAWRHSGQLRMAYLQCTVAAPLSPVAPELVIDRLTGPHAEALVAAGYPMNSAGEVEGIRLEYIQECCFRPQGVYGGNNTIHKLAEEDEALLSAGGALPPDALEKSTFRPSQIKSREARAPKPPVATSSVDRVTVEAKTVSLAFDAYVMVDWSSSSAPVTGNDSIWIASGTWSGRTFAADSPRNVATRFEASKILQGQIMHWQQEGKRVLVGLDFAFGYPAGFARALGLTYSAGYAWKALHQFFAAHVTDSPENEHNRDSFAHQCNCRVGAPGPFWGCTASSATQSLTQQRIGVFEFPHHNLEEWRTTDIAARRRVTTQSVWKLNCGVAVGGQTILGIKYLDDLAGLVNGHRWPFEGWGTPDKPGVWFAEIFPSLIRYSEWNEEYNSRRDRTQVQSCLRFAAERDSAGLLQHDFAKPSVLNDPSVAAKVEDEEGWILWV